MYEIIEVILVVLGLFFGFKLASFVFKRLRTVKQIASLKSSGGVVSFRGFILRPNWIKPMGYDIKVEFRDTVYYIRLFSGTGSSRSVHFASEEFWVVYSKLRAMGGRTRKRGGVSFVTHNGTTVKMRPKVYIMPPFKVDEQTDKKQVKVLLFSPAPFEVTYVTETKTTIRLAFTGDEIHGMRIFTSSTFVAYADRATRENDDFLYFK